MTATAPAPSGANSVLKPAMLLMCGRTLAFIATFFIPVVLARIFDPAQFGTYKQLFLIHSTAYFIAQVGMASSLYYFLPQAGETAGKYVANSVVFLGLAGCAGFALLAIAAPWVAKWMSNPALAGYLWWTGLYLALMMFSASLEIVLISQGKYLWASISYAVSDLGRAAALIAPVLIFRNLESLLIASVVVAALRLIAAVGYFHSTFGRTFRPDGPVLRKQLAYALPFGAAVLVEIFYGSLPQYVVSFLANPATFAVFAVGCLQIPLVDFAASPTSDVMMVKMQENLARGHLATVLEIWHDTFWKLALLFFPLVALVIVEGRDIILALFTAKYAASIPLFRIWSLLILMATLQLDGVLRVYAETRYILMLNLMRLAIVGILIAPSMKYFGLLGPVGVIVLATVAFKTGALIRVVRLFQTPWAEFLPWRRTAILGGAAVAASLAAAMFKTAVSLRPLLSLLSASTIYSVVYIALVWRLGLITDNEKTALTGWLSRRLFRRAAPAARAEDITTTAKREDARELCAESPASSV
ncbi:MAG: oligosaccharide flippase family protein [Acidobacteriota bacterium]|nr:oligosaccharide flippase family protein [Acidobacteriota bacterium]